MAYEEIRIELRKINEKLEEQNTILSGLCEILKQGFKLEEPEDEQNEEDNQDPED